MGWFGCNVSYVLDHTFVCYVDSVETICLGNDWPDTKYAHKYYGAGLDAGIVADLRKHSNWNNEQIRLPQNSLLLWAGTGRLMDTVLNGNLSHLSYNKCDG